MKISNKPLAFLLPLIALLAACTKIETTTLGSDLIPVVDNINTFDTVLDVISTNYIPVDSTRMFASDQHVVGGISNDPQFGTSKATMFFEMKPSTFPFSFAPKDSIIAFDSAVLVLDYVGYYGDSATPVNFNLYQVETPMQRDTVATPQYTLNPNIPIDKFTLWGQKSMAAMHFKDTIPIYRGDSLYGKVANQLRIPLRKDLASKLFFQDSASGAFLSDSAYKLYLPGFALEAQGNPQTLMYFNLQGSTSRLEFFYRKNPYSLDTVSTSFTFTGYCAHAVKFEHNRSGAEVMNFLTADPNKGNDQVYVQATPGTAVKVKIPGLKTLSNRVIHRAELRVTELTPNNGVNSQLGPPPLLYLDAADTANTFRGIPYDLTPFTHYYCFPSTVIEFFYFGGNSKTEIVNGEQLNVYRFNITRHVQSIITRQEQVYDFRLSAPYYMYYANCANSNYNYPKNYFKLLNPSGGTAVLPGRGRIRLAGGSNTDLNKRMQLRIIYSKL